MRTVPPLKELNHLVQKPNYKTEGNWMVRTFLREAALPFTRICLLLGISANAITSFAIVTAVVAAYLLAHRVAAPFLVGTILLQFWYYLDHVDGQIARFHGQASLSGRFFDFIMHHLVHGAVFFGMGVYLFLRSNADWQLALCGFSTISMMVFNLLYDARYKVYFETVEKKGGDWSIVTSAITGESTNKSPSIAKRLYSLLHKTHEIHVVMNILTATAIWTAFSGSFFWRDCVFYFYGFGPVILLFAKLLSIIRGRSIDSEFGKKWKRLE